MIHPYAYRTGLIATAVGIIYTLISYLVGVVLFTNFYIPIILLVLFIIYFILSLKKIKGLLDGDFPFSVAFMNFMVMVALYIVISQTFYFLLIYVIDADFGMAVNDAIIEKTIGMMERFGAPENAIAETLEEMEVQFENQSTIGGMLLGMLKNLGFMAVVGLIVAAIMKSKKENIIIETVD
jgi:hypothetical protein